ncbi:unnamed protein product [Vicia faba]|uniref:Kinesin-like protein n=1 Tax=Vicia faba TaxID=3906 RepID=A0AAV1AQK9_VICFA|nr:unnamed protein product [Vicia faba]
MLNSFDSCIKTASSGVFEGITVNLGLWDTAGTELILLVCATDDHDDVKCSTYFIHWNIRVFCRVRPLLHDESRSTEDKIFSYPTPMEASGRQIDLAQNGQKHSFTFDKVFIPEVSQEEVFVEISQLVQSALDGYKVCIFAYGQTGSGKTYTMMGRPGHPEEKGLIPRSLEQIFQTKQSQQPQGWKYEMQVSMLEIYNETIRDLMSTNRSSSENGTPGKQHTIKHDASGNTQVSDLTVVDVHSAKEVAFLLNQAANSRSVGKTQMNEQSSRSHFVFTLRICGVNESTDQQVQGVLNLIDLAGSERLSKKLPGYFMEWINLKELEFICWLCYYVGFAKFN